MALEDDLDGGEEGRDERGEVDRLDHRTAGGEGGRDGFEVGAHVRGRSLDQRGPDATEPGRPSGDAGDDRVNRGRRRGEGARVGRIGAGQNPEDERGVRDAPGEDAHVVERPRRAAPEGSAGPAPHCRWTRPRRP